MTFGDFMIIIWKKKSCLRPRLFKGMQYWKQTHKMMLLYNFRAIFLNKKCGFPSLQISPFVIISWFSFLFSLLHLFIIYCFPYFYVFSITSWKWRRRWWKLNHWTTWNVQRWHTQKHTHIHIHQRNTCSVAGATQGHGCHFGDSRYSTVNVRARVCEPKSTSWPSLR